MANKDRLRFPGTHSSILAVLLVLFSSVVLSGQNEQTPTKPDVEKANSIAEPVQAIRHEAEQNPKNRNEKAQVFWLVYPSTQLQKHNILEQLAQTIAEEFSTKKGAFTRTRHSIVSLETRTKFQAKSLKNVTNVRSTISQLSPSKNSPIQNPYKVIRDITKTFSDRSGSRYMVLLTLVNGDAEDQLERTLAKLEREDITFYAISREAVFSDSFWEQKKHQKWIEKTDMRMAGFEAPYREFPYGWILQKSEITKIVPSGFGYYGLSRLATKTGGTYYLFSPPSESSTTFCKSHKCRLCEGAHKTCQIGYKSRRLDELAPYMVSRQSYKKRMTRSKLYRRYINVWHSAWNEGLFASPPPFDPQKTRTSERPSSKSRASNFRSNRRSNRRAKQGGDWRKKSLYGSNPILPAQLHGVRPAQLRTYKTKARQALTKISNLMRRLKPAIQYDLHAYDHPRIAASSELMYLLLHITRFNLKQTKRFVRHALEQPPSRNPLITTGFESVSNRTIHIQSDTIPYCHGTEQISQINFLGGRKAKRELSTLHQKIKTALKKYRGTPWGMAIRRVGPVVFERSHIPLPSSTSGNQSDDSDSDNSDTESTQSKRDVERTKQSNQQDQSTSKNQSKPDPKRKKPKRPRRRGSGGSQRGTTSSGR